MYVGVCTNVSIRHAYNKFVSTNIPKSLCKMEVCVIVCMYAYMCVNVYVHMCVRMYVYIYVCMHVCL